MIRHRTLGALVVLGTTAALGAISPLPAHASQAQTIEFTSTPPSGKDWLTGQNKFGFPQYVAEATASSGLPVEYSIAPESADVCEFTDDGLSGSGAGIAFRGGGTCTVLADQPGNDDFLPASQVSQTFQVEKVPATLLKVKGRKGNPGRTPATFSATLQTLGFVDSFSIGPVPFLGQVVTFSVAGKPICSGITGHYGFVTCRATLPRSDQFKLRFTASYAGTADYKAVAKSAYFGI